MYVHRSIHCCIVLSYMVAMELMMPLVMTLAWLLICLVLIFTGMLHPLLNNARHFWTPCTYLHCLSNLSYDVNMVSILVSP